MTTIQIHLKSHRADLLKKALKTIQILFKNFSEYKKKTDQTKFVFHQQNKTKKLFTVIRSPHVHKKSREQFHLTEFHSFSSIHDDNLAPFLYLIENCSLYGVQIKISYNHKTFF